MCRPNFRIKLDLCKFYNDIRRICWVFVDSAKMSQVSHMKEHITELFGIKEPFHLLLNEIEYLPPNEDIRILRENETILVSPIPGLENKLELTTSAVEKPPDNQNNVESKVRANSFAQRKELQTNILPLVPNPVSVIKHLVEEETSDTCTVLHTAEDEEDSLEESKGTDTSSLQVSDSFSISDQSALRPKRKRVRHRKAKSPKAKQENVSRVQTETKKPKIIDSYTISTGKHIRFDHIENGDFMDTKAAEKRTVNGSHTNNTIAPSHELANLLSLSRNSTPLTFSSPQVKNEVKVEDVSLEETQPVAPPEKTSESATLNNKLEDGTELSSEKLESLPIMTRKPLLHDIIAFKMLKIGSDYTPQVSEFIVAKVLLCLRTDSSYTFRVLQGMSEVKVPVGKFTIIEQEEERVINDTVVLNYAQLIEPRLVSGSDSNGRSTPIN